MKQPMCFICIAREPADGNLIGKQKLINAGHMRTVCIGGSIWNGSLLNIPIYALRLFWMLLRHALHSSGSVIGTTIQAIFGRHLVPICRQSQPWST